MSNPLKCPNCRIKSLKLNALAMEAKLFSEQMKAVRESEKKERDIIYREHMARERVKIMEQKSYERLLFEKNKSSP